MIIKTELVLISLALPSCIPNRLVPYDFTIKKNNDEAYVSVNSVTIALKNLEIKGDHYVFGMEVQNKSAKPIFINTDKIQKYAHHISHQEDESAKYHQEMVSVMSPAEVNQFFKEKRQEVQATAAFLFLLGAAISTHDAIKDEKDNSKEY
ncbi:MAG: hypothetical protein AAF600_17045 [Bacteroidota bacterium]